MTLNIFLLKLFIFSSGRRDAVEVLLEYGADINNKDKDDNTPLHLAAKKSDCFDYTFHIPLF